MAAEKISLRDSSDTVRSKKLINACSLECRRVASPSRSIPSRPVPSRRVPSRPVPFGPVVTNTILAQYSEMLIHRYGMNNGLLAKYTSRHKYCIWNAIYYAVSNTLSRSFSVLCSAKFLSDRDRCHGNARICAYAARSDRFGPFQSSTG